MSRPKGPIPKFTVNLSLPPEERYVHIAQQLEDKIDDSELTELFFGLVHALAGPRLGPALCSFARFALRRVYTAEETAELRGIRRAARVPLHVLVAFNVLLDLLLGCTSGGARVLDEELAEAARHGDVDGASAEGRPESRIVHFRTLDWGMDQLRRIVVELEFVRRDGGPVVATSVTYFGYVGVLTGVRPGLSMSLNFRPHHDRGSWSKRLAFRWHQAMVVLGFRQSIASVMRGFLLGGDAKPARRWYRWYRWSKKGAGGAEGTGEAVDMETILTTLETSKSTAAYLIFCTPQKAFVVEKDNRSASTRFSDTFLTAYNHDLADTVDPVQLQAAAGAMAQNEDAIGMEDVVTYSLDRENHLNKLWKKKVRSCRRKLGYENDRVRVEDVVRMVRDKEISNEETHYAVVMDPASGKVLWRCVYEAEECLAP